MFGGYGRLKDVDQQWKQMMEMGKYYA